MQTKLIIYLHANDLLHPDWVLVNADGVIERQQRASHPEELAALASEKEIIVIVPSQDVLLTTVNLPKMNRNRLIQAIPFVLEEHLVQDVELMHFAVDSQQEDGSILVAAIADEKMRVWLDLLSSWSVRPDAFVPLSLLLPVEDNHWTAHISDVVTVRMSKVSAAAFEAVSFVDCIQFALKDLTVPQQLQINNYTESAYADCFDASLNVVERIRSADDELKDIALLIKGAPEINLLQGDYAVKKSNLPHIAGMYKIGFYLVASWIVLLFLYPFISYFILHSKVNALDQQIAAIYKRHFPQSTSVIAPKLRMQEKLQKMNADVGENRVLQLMDDVGKAMQESHSIKLKRFDYQNNQLTLELTAANSEDFSAFSDHLTQQGLSVKQQNADLAGSHINATLQVE